MKKITIALVFAMAAFFTVTAQKKVVSFPDMSKRTVQTANPIAEGLSAQSAYLYVDLMRGMNHDEVAKRYNLTRSAGRITVPAFALLAPQADANQLARYGVRLKQRSGDMATLQIPLSSFIEFAQSGLCSHLDIGVKAHTSLDQVRNILGIDAIHAGLHLPQGYDGEGVVVGIVDVGLEYAHPSFYDSDNSTLRVKRVWDQTADVDSTQNPARFAYGAEYTTQSEIIAAARSHVDQSHGTHIAGTAAGTGGTTDYKGIAPKADLVFVATTLTSSAIFDGISYIRDYADSVGKPCVINLSIGSQEGPHDGSSSFDRMCINMISERPDSLLIVGSVSNDGDRKIHTSKTFSLGDPTYYDDTVTQQYPSFLRDTIPYTDTVVVNDTVLDSLSGEIVSILDTTYIVDTFRIRDTLIWRDTTVVRQRAVYSGGDSMLYTLINFDGTVGGVATVDMWGEGWDGFEAGIAFLDTTTGTFVDAGQLYSSATYHELTDTIYYDDSIQVAYVDVYASGFTFYSNREEIHLIIDNSAQTNPNLMLCLVVKCNADATVHAWAIDATFTNAGYDSIADGNSNYTAGEVGGSCPSIISVGSYVSRASWTDANNHSFSLSGLTVGERSSFSSLGPTTDGRIKPDVMAPGQYIAAPCSRFDANYMNSTYTCATENYNGNEEYYGVMQGTSMSAPMVTGVLALWLQANPSLNADTVLSIIRATSISDNITGVIDSTGSTSWGWGRINPMGGLPLADTLYTLFASPSSVDRGSVTGAGVYPADTTITITATPLPGYHFAGWNDGDSLNPRTVTISSNMALVAIFDENEFEECPPITSLPWQATFNDDFLCWSRVDADGDGYNWRHYAGYAVSETYAYFDRSDQDLTPNNWLISQPIELGDQAAILRWSDKALSDDYYAEHYSVYISTTGDELSDFGEPIFSTTLTGPAETDRSFDLADYAGQTIHIAFRHHDPGNAFILGIRKVRIMLNQGIDQPLSDAAATVSTEGRTISVSAPQPTSVTIIDAIGRTVATSASQAQASFVMPSAGIYMVKVGNGQYHKVAITR
ncbi:MAG: S8 family serine peptidase [Bacteroidales bacterium]|nr:S8 family serine peptidase [Bacteroidales bacterium]